MKEHPCQYCTKTFEYESLYNRHILTHTNSKPHKCQFCSKAFKRSDTLRTHMNIHSNQGHLRCCGKVFNSKASFNYHKKMHQEGRHSEKKHKCLQCNADFFTKQEFQLHSKENHQVQQLNVFGDRSCFKEESTTQEVQIMNVDTPLRIAKESIIFFESMKLSLFEMQ